MADEVQIVFTPSGRRGRFPAGTPLLTAARSLGVDIDSVCGGRGICGRCQVSLSAGAFAKFAITSADDHLSAPGEVERSFAETSGLADGRRLSCAARAVGDVVIDVPAESQVHRQIVRKRADARSVEVDPMVRLHYVELTAPSLGDQTSDLERVKRALAEQWQLTALDCDWTVLHALPEALRQGEWKVTVAVREERTLVAVWPGFRDRALGIAVDVGTTTLAAHLCDLASGAVLAAAGAMNPQIRFGEDVMSRLSYLQMNPDQAGAPTAMVRKAIRKLAAEAAHDAGADASDIIEATFVGNPTMHHLLLGIDPAQLGRVPFALVVDEPLTVAARELGLDFHPGARAFFLPCIAGHVGADAAGVLLAEAPQLVDEVTLLVDIGTNAEVILGNRERVLACSCPTGPAFEGAQISCGQRAAPGAIERVRIDRATLAPRFKVIGCEAWSDEPDFASQVTGVCGSGIIEAVAEMHLAGIVTQSGLIDGRRIGPNEHLVRTGKTYAYRLHPGPTELRITQHDIRAIQLAKAALYSSVRILLERYGADAVERIVLTGAFGSYIDPAFAMALGMIPDCDAKHVAAAGNAAGTGARIALLNRVARDEIASLVRQVEKIETAAEPRFQDYFVAAMAIPHASDRFPNLERALAGE